MRTKESVSENFKGPCFWTVELTFINSTKLLSKRAESNLRHHVSRGIHHWVVLGNIARTHIYS